MKFFLFTTLASQIALNTQNQVLAEELEDEKPKMEPETVVTPEGTFQYYRTNFESIPLGRSSRNSAGYRQLGSYSTRLNEKG